MFKAWQSRGRQEAKRRQRGHHTGRTRAGAKNDYDYDNNNDDVDDNNDDIHDNNDDNDDEE